MQSRCSGLLLVVCLLGSFLTWGQSIQRAPIEDSPSQNNPVPNAPAQNMAVQPGPATNGGDFSTNTHPGPEEIVPRDTIIVKGAWSSASDSTTPVPESATLTNNVFTDQYFGITYPVPLALTQKFTPPPPSENGSYVLAQLAGSNSYQFGRSSAGALRGSILFAAHDLFFTPLPVANARQFVNYSSSHLPEYYKAELKPTQTTIGGQPFTFFAYGSPEAELHWYVLTTQIRCHAVEIVLLNHDPKMLEELVRDMNAKMKFSADSPAGAGGGSVPVCIKDYATGANVIERVDPVLTQQRYNAIPVRIIIDREGKIKHVHFLSAYPEQEKVISDALKQWKFRPYERNGQRFEVETGIMFGRAPGRTVPATGPTTD